MKSLWPKIENILSSIERPVRYIDNEWNVKRKIPQSGDVVFALAYPDVYEVGMSNLGLQILYEILSEKKDVVIERVYAPWVDMEEKMREKNLPLFTLESHFLVNECDIFGFTLQYEMTFTNILNMLDLAGIPLLAKDRKDNYPLIIGGGPCAFNPEPLASFFDLFALGDGEDLVYEIINKFKKLKKKGAKKQDILKSLAKIEGIYVPSLYKVDYHSSGLIKNIKPISKEAPKIVKKRLIEDLNLAKFPVAPVVPLTEVIHDRCSLEITRGCTRGCRFCQAGMIYRPARERSLSKLESLSKELLKNTGYDEISLVSLSSSDYSEIETLVSDLASQYGESGIAISLPSLRMDTFSIGLAEHLARRKEGAQRVKRPGLTFAPEAGTQRLRDVINKNLTEEDIISTAELAFKNGWRRLKLYFMIGLPTETQEDLQGIINLVNKVVDLGLKIIPPKERHKFKVNISVASFVPKSHTSFQWVGQNKLDQLLEKQDFLKKHLRGRYVSFKWHEAKLGIIEGVIARGDRRIAGVIKRAWELGCKFDAWREYFDFSKWEKALEEEGLSIDFYANRQRSIDEILPWEHISPGVTKDYLKSEYEKALQQRLTEDCRFSFCNNCGVCQKVKSENLKIKKAKSRGQKVENRRLKSQKITEKTHQPIYRLRIKYGKLGKLKFISHLDLISTIEKSLKRANFPLILTEGFNPRVKVSYGPPLPVGVSSESEYGDIFLSKKLSLKEAVLLLNTTLPDGLNIYQAEYTPLPEPSITKFVNFAKYQIEIEISSLEVKDIESQINTLLSQKELKFTKKGKEKVLLTKQAISCIEIVDFKLGEVTINALLSIGDLGSTRPDLLIKLLFSGVKCGGGYKILNIHRTGLYAKISNEFYDPMGMKLKQN
ncbi:TIGR03960 family B12-binding radical SAM protein [Candidatus Oleimmundimicrobium sp.]|uniref:TIGR03960 family B12-binding radical SAM protein n=1 Tax=Candidatus Oleimmundimicrobium sp. TaxID=3060597 RepID=UPI002723E5A8|nr:TIGR03960 family B12-binding radical SAM protein [Candidatus Oleimmundimicrobium sp.]MDO8886144.1 TIGR03960 family B12-binding radical SAM protein [Candidatus Oleimmundimicrobium sp.]